jgi:hypothetical protein
MPTSIKCKWKSREISIEEALEIKIEQRSPLFQCVYCNERVKAHSGGGHTSAHFEHIKRNNECPFSHGDSYRYGGIDEKTFQNPDDINVIEGYAKERKYLAHHRNAAIVVKCKERDDYTCQTCGFSKRVRGRSVVECHHLNPLRKNGERITSVHDLICLCPTCHRIAHTSNPPLSIEEIKKIVNGSSGA